MSDNLIEQLLYISLNIAFKQNNSISTTFGSVLVLHGVHQILYEILIKFEILRLRKISKDKIQKNTYFS